MSVYEDIATQNYAVVGDYFTQLSQNITLTLATLGYLLPAWTYQNVSDGDTFDFIVVGAGSAGAVLANRLTENPNWKVLLIEAGKAPPLPSVVPGTMFTLVHTESDWDFYSSYDDSTSSAHIQPGVITYTQGKMLGGTSSLGHLFYVRGNPVDYENWVALGNDGWDYKTVLEYFKKSEGLLEEAITNDPEYSSYHNTEGPIKVSLPVWSDVYESKNQAALNSFEELGFKILEDYNGPEQLGVGRSVFMTTKPPQSVRSGTAEAFLVPILSRENLYILPNAYATRVLIENNKANGVEVLVDNKVLKFFSKNEVVVSCGALNTPKLLMASGIGNKDDLAILDVDVIANLPVGYELQDHTVVPLVFKGKSDIQTNLETRIPEANINSLPFPTVTGFFSTLGEKQPDFQVNPAFFGVSSPLLLGFCQVIMDANQNICKAIIEANLIHEIFIVYVIMLHPKSRGQIKIDSVAPNAAPIVDLQYLSDGTDLETFKTALKRIVGLTETSYFKNAGGYLADLGLPNCGALNVTSNAYWDCYIKSTIGTIWHPAGTCSMGKVVDSRLKVYGVEGLRVVDASVMPTLTSGNIDVPVIMIGERASDFIKEDYGYSGSSASVTVNSATVTENTIPVTQNTIPVTQSTIPVTQNTIPVTRSTVENTQKAKPANAKLSGKKLRLRRTG